MAETGKILIADDDETFRESTAALLRRDGFHCVCAADGEEAARALGDDNFDLLIADIHMRGNNGLELVRHLPATSHSLPVILVTGYPSTETAIQSIQLPVVAYLVKPVDWDEMKAAVRRGLYRADVRGAVEATRRRLQDWLREVGQTATALQSHDEPANPQALHSYLMVTVQNIRRTLDDVKRIAESLAAVATGPSESNVIPLKHTTELLDAMNETLDALEKMREVLDATDLAELQQQLEKRLQPPVAD